jgi:hypothetical protein
MKPIAPFRENCSSWSLRPNEELVKCDPCGEVEFFLKLHGLWEGLVRLPRPPPPPFDIETLRRIEPPWRAIKQWIPDQDPELDWFNRPRKDRDEYDQSPTWNPKEVKLDDGRILLLDGD